MRFPMESLLKSHMRSHNRAYPCTQGCDVVFTKWTELVTHNAQHHRNFHCETCGKTFQQEQHLQRHVAVHEQAPKKYPCTVPGCGKTYCSSYQLGVHRKNIHEHVRHPCLVPGCEKVFAHKVCTSACLNVPVM